MAKAVKFKLDVVVDNPLLEIDYPDSRMNKGSLYLLDFSHPLSNPTVPINGASIKNIAWENAKSIIDPSGSTTEANYTSNVVSTATNNGMFLEITPKKGLHAIVSQTNDITFSNDYTIRFPTTLRDYMFNNISRGFFISIWDRKTRLATTSTSSNFLLFLLSTISYYCSFQTGGSGMLGKNLGSRATGTSLNSLSPQCNNTAFSLPSGSPIVTHDSFWKFGSNGAYANFETNKACSNILYQIHIVDLTSAGLTYAQADALDIAAFNLAFGVGGRFYNDVFTNPSTLP